MRVAIHQPNFIPWFGYFYKIAQVDSFVFLNHVEHTKRSFTRRVLIHHPNTIDEDYIRLYLAKNSDFTPINEIQIANQINWQQKIMVQLENAYRKAPYFVDAMNLLSDIFAMQANLTSLSEINISLIKAFTKEFNLTTNFFTSSNLMPLDSSVHINVAICDYLNAEFYISGMGAKKYQNESEFVRKGIHLEYLNPQKVFDRFNITENLRNKSIISWLMFYRKDEIHEMLSFRK